MGRLTQKHMFIRILCVIVMACAFSLVVPFAALADAGLVIGTIEANIDDVRAAIQELSPDPRTYTAEEKSYVESIDKQFMSLDDADRTILDQEVSHSGTGQPLGRVLETALWSVWSYNAIDDTTTLPDGVYDAKSNPALDSKYSKGKSTSSRQRPWSVKSVVVSGGKATATIAVESSSYYGLWMGGTTYPKTNSSGNCEFANVPIDLNSTFYFAGMSSEMPIPIAFSLETWIDEPGNTPSQDDEDRIKAVKDLIEALPDDPKTLLGKTANKDVAAAVAAFNELPTALKAKLTGDERIHLAMCSIIVLPSDAFKITSSHGSAIEAAQKAYEALSEKEQQQLDNTRARSSTSYGRYLESAVWALDGLKTVNNVTLLVPGTYTGQVKSSTSNGKGASGHSTTFSVKSVTVKGGKATAILEHSSNQSEYLLMGGIKYANKQTNPNAHSLFEVPINLNSTFHFSIMNKDARSETDAIVFEMTTFADTNNMKPDSLKPDNSSTPSEADKKDAEKSGTNNGANTNKNTNANNGTNTTDNKKKSSNTGTSKKGSQTNLNSLVSSTSKNSSSSSSASASKSSASASSDEEKSGAAAGTKSDSSGGGSGGSDDTRMSEVGVQDGADGGDSTAGTDLLPAVAGGMLLTISLGAMQFSFRFLRRETAMV